MRFYVFCKAVGHSNEKIYIDFGNTPPMIRNDIQNTAFQLTCRSGHANIYLKNDVQAEVGLEPIWGLILGASLFLVDPLAGIAGAATGLFGVAAREQEKVKRFNESVD